MGARPPISPVVSHPRSSVAYPRLCYSRPCVNTSTTAPPYLNTFITAPLYLLETPSSLALSQSWCSIENNEQLDACPSQGFMHNLYRFAFIQTPEPPTGASPPMPPVVLCLQTPIACPTLCCCSPLCEHEHIQSNTIHLLKTPLSVIGAIVTSQLVVTPIALNIRDGWILKRSHVRGRGPIAALPQSSMQEVELDWRGSENESTLL